MLINPADVAAVADGLVVNAVWAVGQMVARPRESRRAAAGMDIVGWMDTERLTREGLPGARLELAELTDVEAAELETALKRYEVQGALQALLAARLTDAPETDAARAREAVRLALSGAPYAQRLSEYFDDKISALAATLEGRVGYAGLVQVRAEAYNRRIVALLGTITDMLAALSHPDRRGPEEAEFLGRYRRQVRERHGKLEPPDFERRRRVPVADIYVPPGIYQDLHPERNAASPVSETPSQTVWDLAAGIDRTVLLGDPGGGKTTAANALADFFASDPDRKVPLVVTLRDYAAKEPPERSVAGHVEQTLATLYQCPAPDGLVERLLLTGRAVVIFDGLDELLDTSRRAEVSARVEQFCAAYPLTPVLVTSRLVGYDEARLDDDQFSCYRLGGFGEDEVGEYVRKWFALQEGFSDVEAEAEAAAFLAESASVPDLRANPLLLSLMCILYRGEGYLPRNRADVYEQCANLLFRKWDLRRRIHRELRAGHLIEPAIRHLAWWLFDRENPQTAVTERQLIDETTEFLHGREFESVEEAGDAAREFVEFCRGRMWVLSEAGTTADGKKLYAFTHRTFLEYFAAAHLAAKSDTPEDLAHALAPRLADAGWGLVGQLAIQIKDQSSDGGAGRIYASLLDPATATKTGGSERPGENVSKPVLSFLARCLESADPPPAMLRNLTRRILGFLFDSDLSPDNSEPLRELLLRCGRHQGIVAEEISDRIALAVASDRAADKVLALQLVLGIGWASEAGASPFWQEWSSQQVRVYASEIQDKSRELARIRTYALDADIISIEQALAMPGGLRILVEATDPPIVFDAPLATFPKLVIIYLYLLQKDGDAQKARGKLNSIGRHVLSHPTLPWVRTGRDAHAAIRADAFTGTVDRTTKTSASALSLLDEVAYLGAATTRCIFFEISRMAESHIPPDPPADVNILDRYLATRRTRAKEGLPDLPVPEQFRQVFRGWAEGRVDFVEFVDEEPAG